MLTYPHHLTITVAPSDNPQGYLNKTAGEWVPLASVPDGETLYDDDADVQDLGVEARRDQAGLTQVEGGKVVAFLRDESSIARMRPGQVAVVTWEDDVVETFEVLRVSRIDGSLILRGRPENG